jgi:glycerol-3-phosphate acyltransferase PlsY
MTRDISALLIAYLIGSIPSAYLVTRLRTGQDIRQVGEGNAGARNVWHVVGRKWGVLVGVLDIGKGLLACHVSRALGASQLALLLSGFAVVSGHNFPFLRWRQGGKGVAATLGFMLGLLPSSTVAGMALGGVAHLLLRDANRTVVVVCASLVFMPLVFGEPPLTSVYVMTLMLSMALKKIIDLSHERRVWSQSGWTDGATPGFYKEGQEDDGDLRERSSSALT